MSKNKKIIIIVVVSVVLVGIALSVFFIIKNNNTFSYEEKDALRYAKEIKNSLKSPDSFKLYDDIVYLGARVDGEIHVYYYFDFTAENSFGAEVRKQIVFIDGEKRHLDDDDKEVVDARTALNNYKRYGLVTGDSDGALVREVISSKKISSKL